jgi:hypothetical protein
MSTTFRFCFSGNMVNRKAKQVLSGGWHRERGKDIKKGSRRGNMVEILCTHGCKWPKSYLSTLLQELEGGMKENDGGGEFNYDIL